MVWEHVDPQSPAWFLGIVAVIWAVGCSLSTVVRESWPHVGFVLSRGTEVIETRLIG